jgi:hypothetical protein
MSPRQSAERGIYNGHDGGEVCAADRAERQDDREQTRGGGRVLGRPQTRVTGREPLRGDARSDARSPPSCCNTCYGSVLVGPALW